MSEKTKEVPQLADATYAHTLVTQTLSIHCILKFFYLFGFLRHYLLSGGLRSKNGIALSDIVKAAFKKAALKTRYKDK